MRSRRGHSLSTSMMCSVRRARIGVLPGIRSRRGSRRRRGSLPGVLSVCCVSSLQGEVMPGWRLSSTDVDDDVGSRRTVPNHGASTSEQSTSPTSGPPCIHRSIHGARMQLVKQTACLLLFCLVTRGTGPESRRGQNNRCCFLHGARYVQVKHRT